VFGVGLRGLSPCGELFGAVAFAVGSNSAGGGRGSSRAPPPPSTNFRRVTVEPVPRSVAAASGLVRFLGGFCTTALRRRTTRPERLSGHDRGRSADTATMAVQQRRPMEQARPPRPREVKRWRPPLCRRTGRGGERSRSVQGASGQALTRTVPTFFLSRPHRPRLRGGPGQYRGRRGARDPQSGGGQMAGALRRAPTRRALGRAPARRAPQDHGQADRVRGHEDARGPARRATHWSTRATAEAAGHLQSALSRIWRAVGLQPHRTQTIKLSTDPLFVERVRDL